MVILEKQVKKEIYIDDPDFLMSLVQTILQEYFGAEISEHFRTGKHERLPSRLAQRNGYKPKRFNIKVGKFVLDVHLDDRAHSERDSSRGISLCQKALILSLLEMVIQGILTRKVQKITKELCNTTFSKSFVSEWCKKLDDEVGAWLHRPLDIAYPYLIADASYEKIRRDHKVVVVS